MPCCRQTKTERETETHVDLFLYPKRYKFTLCLAADIHTGHPSLTSRNAEAINRVKIWGEKQEEERRSCSRYLLKDERLNVNIAADLFVVFIPLIAIDG